MLGCFSSAGTNFDQVHSPKIPDLHIDLQWSQVAELNNDELIHILSLEPIKTYWTILCHDLYKMHFCTREQGETSLHPPLY